MANSYDTLYNQLPDYFKPIVEFLEILKAHGYALDNLDANALQVAANNYIQTADAATISWWENTLGLTYSFGDTMEFRRQRILQQFNITTPFSIGYLRDQLNGLYGPDGYEIEEDPKNLTLTIRITSEIYGAIQLLYPFIIEVIPAHIQLIANQEVTNDVGGGRLYMGGASESVFIQTISGSNIIDIPGNLSAQGIVSEAILQEIT